jgi:hypothetical protein
VWNAIDRVPREASVWAPGQFTARLAMREKLKSIPPVMTMGEFFKPDPFVPDYIFLFRAVPIETMEGKYQQGLRDVFDKARYRAIVDERGLILLKKEGAPGEEN